MIGTQQLLGPSIVRLDGDTARAETYLLATRRGPDGEGGGETAGAVLHDVLRRTALGWRISKRRIAPIWDGERTE